LPLKITTWNIEHASELVAANPSTDVLSRRQRIKETIESINPDILCIQEGPKGEKAIDGFSKKVLDQKYLPVLLRQNGDALGKQDKEYSTQGEQWIWFLAKPEIAQNCRLQSPTVWKSFTGVDEWIVHFWGQEKSTPHSHYRHPQVMIYSVGEGKEIEIIGVHLKSKINQEPIKRDTNGELIGDYLAEALKARVKLATEAGNVREYVRAKFEQVEFPGILLMGDCNDGPGKDLFEDKYLFFDLISNLQGDVMISERFFNHALFDFAANLRWTAKYRDATADPPIPASKNPLLIDHILISQPLCRGQLPLVANEKAGKVEHEAYERCNAGAKESNRSSDHRPVTLKLDDTI
jgi:endonuclease/exonuclease/phosphatase family metal-dependent hydrolase